MTALGRIVHSLCWTTTGLLIIALSGWVYPPSVQAMATVRLALPVVAVQYAALHFGKKTGVFAQEGLDLEIQVLRTDLAIAALHTGKLDFIAHGGAALRVASRGFPLKLIFALDDRAAFWLLTQPAIQTPAMLKGEKIGVSFPGDTPYLVLKRYLRKHRLDPDRDVTYVAGQISPLGLQGLSAKVLGGAVMAPPYSVIAEHNGFRSLAHLGNEVPDAPTINGIVTSDRKIRSSPDQVNRMVRATLKSVQRYLKDSDGAAAFLGAEFNLDPSTAKRVYREAAALMTANGEVSNAKIRDALALAQELGEPGVIIRDPRSVLDFSFVRAARLALSTR